MIEHNESIQAQLDKIRFGLQTAIGATCIESLEFEKFEDYMLDQIIYKIRGFVLGNDKICTISYPATWWQEIREKVLPKRWLKKRPSIKKIIEATITYPTLNIDLEKHEPLLKFTESVK